MQPIWACDTRSEKKVPRTEYSGESLGVNRDSKVFFAFKNRQFGRHCWLSLFFNRIIILAEGQEKMKKHKTLKRIILTCIAAVIVVAAVIVLRYSNDPFPETQEIAEEMDMEGNDYCFYGDSDVGFIIFAGAKTDEASYSYIAELLHEDGYTVIIPKQLFHLSVFGARHGIEIMEEHPEIDEWILIGHSMGGRTISRIADKEPDKLIGIAFLATFASKDLSDLTFPAIRISAENDGIMDNEQMESHSDRLPEGSVSIMLEGANHRGFGGYSSPFKGDGEASITWQEQNEEVVSLILEFYADQISEAEAAQSR